MGARFALIEFVKLADWMLHRHLQQGGIAGDFLLGLLDFLRAVFLFWEKFLFRRVLGLGAKQEGCNLIFN